MEDKNVDVDSPAGPSYKLDPQSLLELQNALLKVDNAKLHFQQAKLELGSRAAIIKLSAGIERKELGNYAIDVDNGMIVPASSVVDKPDGG